MTYVALAALVVALQITTGQEEDIKLEEIHGDLEPLPSCPPLCGVDEAIRMAASYYNVDYTRLACLARRESTFNPGAQNGIYFGLMQFDQPTWQLTPHAEYGRGNAWAAAMGAAYLISRGESRRWPPYALC